MIHTLTWFLVTYLIVGDHSSEGLAQLLDNDCGRTKYTGSRVAGGQNTQMNSAPWMAYLYTTTKFICGGSLVHKSYILTAAHCFDKYIEVFVRLGDHMEYAITDKYIYPRYKSYTYYDVAVARLSKSVIYTDSVSPICVLLDQRWHAYVNTIPEFIVTGWGATEKFNMSSILQVVSVPQVDRATCSRIYRYRIDNTQICAGDAKHYMGKGDSGSPLGIWVQLKGIQRFVQFGIVSYHIADYKSPAVFTNVLSYSRWISATITTFN
ncbi:serine protease 48-like [Drosophila ficusphila]|uniref:serine protease 48-like n=1 Tax=Drosophila ficusphila TaxID=30025 RepID=UPI0007E6D9D3|nr:serine protease 48-like [Drosophila ficusphila]